MGSVLSAYRLFKAEETRLAHKPIGYNVFRILPGVIFTMLTIVPLLFIWILVDQDFETNSIIMIVCAHLLIIVLAYPLLVKMLVNDWRELMKSKVTKCDTEMAYGLKGIAFLAAIVQISLYWFGHLSLLTFFLFFVCLMFTVTLYFYLIYPNMKTQPLDREQYNGLEHSVISLYYSLTFLWEFTYMFVLANEKREDYTEPVYNTILNLIVQLVFCRYYGAITVEYVILTSGQRYLENNP